MAKKSTDIKNKKQSLSSNTEPKAIKAEIVTTTQKSNSSVPVVTDGLTAYLDKIQQYPLLTREQEHEIATRYRETHNPKDAEILVTSNLRFVVKVAAEYSKFGSKIIDLIQEGNMGLMHAVKEYNPYKGVRLITYAVWWIRGYIQEYLMRQYSMVRIGTTQNQRKLFYRLEKEKEKLGQQGIEPTPKALSTSLGVTEEELELMQQRLSAKDISLDAPLGDDSSSKLLDFEADNSESPEDAIIREQSLYALEKALEKIKPNLGEKEILILKDRILAENPKTLQEVGDAWGVTREAVRQMESRLINKIKNEIVK